MGWTSFIGHFYVMVVTASIQQCSRVFLHTVCYYEGVYASQGDTLKKAQFLSP
jgi:hypothetical protein